MTTELRQRRSLPRIVPERIKEAREARGLTREDLAEALGISVQAVSQYEVGQTAPGPEALTRIIALTHQPPAFFTANRQRFSERSGMPFWRSLVRMKRPDRLRVARRLEWAADVVNYLERFIELPPLRLPSVSLPQSPMDWESLETAALAVREAWELGNLPVRHMAATLETNGIILIKEPVRCEDMDAVSIWQAGRPYVLLAEDKFSLPRENFDLAHELGHMLLHPHVEVSSANLPNLERQANYFAGALLLPRATFSQEIFSTSVEYFIELKSRWRVSIQAMIYRCKDLGILNKHQVSYLWRQMSARNIRVREPLDGDFTPEKPSLLSAALNMLIENRVQTRSQILEALKLNSADIESLCGTESGYLDERVIPLGLKPRA
jgi:Zn-dependent peptidase ImmA (M78 family)/DNA-binding transcriptional regulator YiaG